MARLERIQDYVNKSMPAYQAAHILPRNIMLPADNLMRGDIRFARKVGNFLPIFVPDNSTNLTQEAHQNDQIIYVDRFPSWYDIDCVLSLAHLQLTEIDDLVYDSDRSEYKIFLKEELNGDVASGEDVVLYGTPIEVNTLNPIGSRVRIEGNNQNTAIIFYSTTGDGVRIQMISGVAPLSIVTNVLAKTIDITFQANVTQANDIIVAMVGNPLGFTLVAPFSNGTGTYVVGDDNLYITDTPPSVRVVSKYKIFSGDAIAYKTEPTLIGSLLNTEVLAVEYIGTIAAGYVYDLTLEAEVDVEVGQTIYLRGRPAYESEEIFVPDLPYSNQNIGPFVIDYISGPLLDSVTEEISEVFNIELYSTGGTLLYKQDDVGKNFPIQRVPLDASMPLFWDLLEGSLNFEATKYRMIGTSSDISRFAIITHLIPNFRPGLAWTFTVEAEVDTELTFHFPPNAQQSFSLLAGIPTGVVISIPPGGEDATRMEISALTSIPNKRIYVGSSSTVGSRVGKIKYSIVSTADGEYTWGASGLLVKPYFLQLALLEAQYSVIGHHNRGNIHMWK
jgi:hypothetical protein